MKKIAILFALILGSCSVPPPIVTVNYSLQLPSGAGVSSTLNFTDFTGATESGKTKLTFTNADGDVLIFLVAGIKRGNFPIEANPMTGSFTIQDESGQLTSVQVQSNGVGSITIDAITGTGANIKGIFGSFESNMQVAGDAQAGTSAAGSGTIKGNIGFNNT